jgi:hypothetical protein
VLGVSASAVSHQLRGLRALRLVKGRRDGKMNFYSLDDEHVTSLIEVGLAHERESAHEARVGRRCSINETPGTLRRMDRCETTSPPRARRPRARAAATQ